jgi:hypothetical protein
MPETSAPTRIQPINIRKIFAGKNASLARLLPGFVFRYLEKIVRQKDVNDFLERHGEKMGLDFVKAVKSDFNIDIEVKGAENVPSEGRYIFASNHPLGGIDGIMLMEVMSRFYPDFRILANDLLMNVINLRPLLLEINKHGKQNSESVVLLDEKFRSDCQILTFPAGLVSRKVGHQVMDLEWHKNFISKAIQYKRDVIPVHFSGSNTKFFYGLYKVRKFFGIKANLEMFYLVDETFRHKNEHLTVIFGKPIPWSVFDKSKTPKQWARWVKEQSYALGGITRVYF